MAPTAHDAPHPPTIDAMDPVGAADRSPVTAPSDPTQIDPATIGSWATGLKMATAPLRNRWLDLEIVGRVNVPTDGPAIIAANHLSFIDSPLLMTALGRSVTFLGKAEYLDHPVTRTIFPRVGMIPVDRRGRGVTWSLNIAQQRLEAGELIGIFPEGSRSRDGRLHRGHLGAAHLAMRTGAPIIPVGIIGTDTAMPVGRRLPRRHARVIVQIGSPIGLGEYRSQPRTAAAKHALTDALMAEIGALIGQPVVDEHLPIPS
ncbi:MAG: lysophospholipid acyltransferase family protein [Actinomycetota bacterium]